MAALKSADCAITPTKHKIKNYHEDVLERLKGLLNTNGLKALLMLANLQHSFRQNGHALILVSPVALTSLTSTPAII